MDFLIIAIELTILLHVGALAIAGRLCRQTIAEFSLNMGPKLWSKKIKGIEWSVRALPLGGYTKFENENFVGVRLTVIILILLSGCTLTYLTAVLALGRREAHSLIGGGFIIFFKGALSPSKIGREFVLRAAQYCREHSFLAILGAVCGWSTVVNLIPNPLLNGGAIIMHMFKAVVRISEGLEQKILLWSFLLHSVFMVGWAAAIYYAIWGAN